MVQTDAADVPLIVAIGSIVNGADAARGADAMIVADFPKGSLEMPSPAIPTCPHKRTRLIAKDNDAQYVECLDCGEILEAGEMEKKKDAVGYDESLSDA